MTKLICGFVWLIASVIWGFTAKIWKDIDAKRFIITTIVSILSLVTSIVYFVQYFNM